MRLVALDVSIDLIRELRVPVNVLRGRNPDLHRQIRSAASSVSLNLAEGNGRWGKDRTYHFRVALGSAEEVRAALRVAIAWGDLEEARLGGALRLLDRLVGLCWGLAR